jgi:hypothetical protein
MIAKKTPQSPLDRRVSVRVAVGSRIRRSPERPELFQLGLWHRHGVPHNRRMRFAVRLLCARLVLLKPQLPDFGRSRVGVLALGLTAGLSY